MALIKCPDCGKEFSDQAPACPNCGRPNTSCIDAPQSAPPINNTPKNKEKSYKTVRLVIGIISIVLFFLVSLQSCAAGIGNALSASGEVSGSAGFLLAICMLISGIITICLKNKKTNIAFILPTVFYMLGAIIAAANVGSYSDLKIWSIIAALFGVLHIYCLLSVKRVNKIVCIAVSIIVFLVFAFFPSGGNGQDQTTMSNADNAAAETETQNESANAKIENTVIKNEVEQLVKNEEITATDENVSGSVEVLAEYTLPDSIGWYTRHFIIVKNNSSQSVDISTSSLAYSADGTMVSAANASFDALGTGCTSIMYEAFETDVEIDHYETTMNVVQSDYYESVIQDLSYTENDIEGGAIFQVTNNGEEPAEFVEGYVLFFLGDELVGYDSTYFTDDDSEIKPGETISNQINSYEDFDRLEFYLTGRIHK